MLTIWIPLAFSSSVQTVYLSDEKNNVVAVKFWGGLQVLNSISLHLICSLLNALLHLQFIVQRVLH